MTIHKPVLLEEVISGLNLKKGSVVVDATLGGGGHSREILKIIGKKGRLVVIDQDEKAIENFKKQLPPEVGNSRLASTSSLRESRRVVLVKDNFSNLENILGGQGIKSVDAVLADLGFSSDQLEDSARGLSFQKNAQLDMRLGKDSELTAKKVVNNYSQGELIRILKTYGEERFAKNIARKIIEFRKRKEIGTTFELVEIISNAIPGKHKHGKIHFATKTFQALRIEVNRELENLEKFLPQAIDALNSEGRLAVISFHSLEDRIVKNIFRVQARGCLCPAEVPICLCGHKAKIKIITKKPVTSGEEETGKNPRARSAKLRIVEKIHPVK